ncbi:MAG: ATP-binding cassette domain-containing protein [Clostridia bacterium]|nr:ATP-binding cassette domain-containing protein [Clostridia bacterium]
MFFETKNLCFSYYKSPLYLKDVNFSIAKNSKTMVLASKDSGKTTILKVLSGFEDSRFGNIYLNGKELKEISDKDKNFSLVLADLILFERKTIKQNLDYQLQMAEIEGVNDESLSALLNEFDIDSDLKVKVKKLSLLNKRKLQIVRAILKKPQILFLDDQFEGLNNDEIQNMFQIYQKLLKMKDLTFVFTIGDETYKKLRNQLSQENFSKVVYLNLSKTYEFKTLVDFEKAYLSLDSLKFLENVNLVTRYIEKEDKTYTLLNGEIIQFVFDIKFNKALDALNLGFAEIEEVEVVLLCDEKLDEIDEKKFNELLKSNKCIIFSKLTENRII